MTKKLQRICGQFEAFKVLTRTPAESVVAMLKSPAFNTILT